MVITFTAAILFLVIGLWQLVSYKKLKNDCTCTTTGVITNEAHYYGVKSFRYQEKIEVKTDQYFNKAYIYARAGAEKEGDMVIIHYDKENTERYYINDRVDEYKDNAVIIFLISGSMLILTVFLAVVIRKQYRRRK